MKETLLNYIDSLPDSAGRAQEIVDDTVLRMKELILDTLMSARVQFYSFRSISGKEVGRKSSNCSDTTSS